MRIFVLALLVATVTCVSVRQAKVGNSVYDDDWETYKIQYEKTYESLEEEIKRRLIWEDNMALINKHNLEAARGQHSYTMGLGPFTDLTNQEFSDKISCINGKDLPTVQTTKTTYKTQTPASIDWRTKGVVSSVKNQASCGSCWAFSTVGCVESRQALKNGNAPLDLSPQQLVDCDTNDNGCNGGNPYSAFQYMQTNGVEKWSDYPYAEVQQSCSFDSSKVAARVSNIGFIQGDENQMLQEVGNNGPLAITLNAGSSSFQNYKSGVLDDPSCPTQINHGVIAVGYGTDASGKDYWIVKNSWAASWGDQGYIKIVRNKNMCGINTLSTYSNAS